MQDPARKRESEERTAFQMRLTIDGVMTMGLKLKKSDLLVYALIFSITQNGDTVFFGGQSLISKVTGVGLSSVKTSLKKLTDDGLLSKRYRGPTNNSFCDYWVNMEQYTKAREELERKLGKNEFGAYEENQD